MPDSAMTWAIVVWWKPSRATQRTAAESRCCRRASRVSALILGTGTTLNRTIVLDNGGVRAHRRSYRTIILFGVVMTRPHSPWAPVAALVLLISALVVAFAWPTSRLAPHHLPVAVAGPPRAAHQVQAQLDRALGPDAVDVTPVGDRHAVVAQIRHRAAYAGLVPPAGPGRPPELLVASAASPAVAQGLTAAAETGAGGSAPKITDVAPLPAADPHGAVFALATVPL